MEWNRGLRPSEASGRPTVERDIGWADGARYWPNPTFNRLRGRASLSSGVRRSRDRQKPLRLFPDELLSVGLMTVARNISVSFCVPELDNDPRHRPDIRVQESRGHFEDL